MINKINKWIIVNSNGDWEHEYSFRINSTDYPGWAIEIDLSYTTLSGIEFSYMEADGDSFIEVNVINDIFKAYCSLDNYTKCLSIFFDELLLKRSNKDFEYEAYTPFFYKNDVFYTKIIGVLTDDMRFKVLKIPNIKTADLKVVTFETLTSNTYEQEFPKLNIQVNDVLDFDIIRLSDGSYPLIIP